MEVRPSKATNETRDGRRAVYRDVSKRSSNSSSLRHSVTPSDRSHVSTPSSASSATYMEFKPAAPTPPPVAPNSSFQEDKRVPQSPMSPPDPKRTVEPGSTAAYEYPPHLEPEIVHRERPRGSEAEQRMSPSSTAAEIDDAQPSTPPKRRRPTISIDTGTRRDSGRDIPRESRKEGKRPVIDDPQRDKEPDRSEPSETEEERQARLERERIAASDIRQAARVRKQQAREASRERHVRDARDALEGCKQSQPEVDPYIEAAVQAELAQIEREKQATRQRESYDASARQYADEQRRVVEAENRSRYPYSPLPASPTAVRPPLRRTTGDSFPGSNPPSPYNAKVQPRRVSVHQDVRPAQPRSSIREKGMDVIEREMAAFTSARAASEQISSALGDVNLDDRPYSRDYDNERNYDRRDDRRDDGPSSRVPESPIRRQRSERRPRPVDDYVEAYEPCRVADEDRRGSRDERRSGRSDRPTVEYEPEYDEPPPARQRDSHQYDEYGDKVRRRRPTAREEYYEDGYERTEDSRRGDEGQEGGRWRRRRRDGRGNEVHK